MRIKVKFFATCRELFQAPERNVEIGGVGTVRTLLDDLCDTPERRREIFAGRRLQPHLVVMVNGVHVQSLKGLDTELSAGDTVAVFPFVAGG